VTDDTGLTDEISHVVTVPEPPKAKIEFPASGGTYKQGEVVATAFSCEEGAGGTSLESCGGVKGSGGTGTLDTEELGEFPYTVTAKSADGLTGGASINYSVISACNTIHGYGRVGSYGSEGTIVSDELSLHAGAKERFEAGLEKWGLGQLRLRSLTSSLCKAIVGGREFQGKGPATLKGVGGYVATFSFAVAGSHITFSLEVTKGLTLLYSSTQSMLPGAVEVMA
jgi:hypothetical protein